MEAGEVLTCSDIQVNPRSTALIEYANSFLGTLGGVGTVASNWWIMAPNVTLDNKRLGRPLSMGRVSALAFRDLNDKRRSISLGASDCSVGIRGRDFMSSLGVRMPLITV